MYATVRAVPLKGPDLGAVGNEIIDGLRSIVSEMVQSAERRIAKAEFL